MLKSGLALMTPELCGKVKKRNLRSRLSLKSDYLSCREPQGSDNVYLKVTSPQYVVVPKHVVKTPSTSLHWVACYSQHMKFRPAHRVVIRDSNSVWYMPTCKGTCLTIRHCSVTPVSGEITHKLCDGSVDCRKVCHKPLF